MSKDSGGSAFPQVKTEYFGHDPDVKTYGGMSLRDYFAGQVLASLSREWPYQPEMVANKAYLHADAMLAARNKEA